MRRQKKMKASEYRIAIIDDEQGIIDTLTIIIKRLGYDCIGFTDPAEAVQALKNQPADLLILDYLMNPIHGDEVIKLIRRFDQQLYILLLTGHKDIAPPLDTIKALDIQGYSEKSDDFDQLILLIESGIKSVKQLRLIKSYQTGLNALIDMAPDIYQLQPIDSILQTVVQKLAADLQIQDAFVILYPLLEDESPIFEGVGHFASNPVNLIFRAEPLSGVDHPSMLSSLQGGSSRASYVFSLNNEEKRPIGLIGVGHTVSEFSLQLVELLAHQVSLALSNAQLHSRVQSKCVELVETYSTLERVYLDTIQALRLAVDAKDVYTRGHSDRVAVYAMRLGNALGLSQREQELLRLSGIFHDIGKIGTADDILFKTDALDSDEYERIKKHPADGATILSAISEFEAVVPIVLNHHERMDGLGYPSGAKGESIPFLSRILAVADAFDAMTSTRLYRKKVTWKEAVKQLKKASGSQFDKNVVDSFASMIDTLGDAFVTDLLERNDSEVLI